MTRAFGISVFLLLQLCYHVDCCPKGCQCFTPSKVFCSEDVLKDMPQNLSSEVQELVIMTTSIKSIHLESFPLNSSLTKLMLLNNLLNGVSEMAFNRLLELKELEISGNHNFKVLGTGTFKRVGNLTKLLLNYNQLKTLDDSIFASLQKLEILQLKGNAIDHLPRLLFRHLRWLRSLDFSENKILTLDKDIFNSLLMLETLRMNHNLISVLHPDTFINMPHLRELGLQGNRIEDLHLNLLSGLEHLNKLHLRGNLITKIAPGTFPPNLKELNLEDNRLVELSTGVFQHMSFLTDLVLAKNRLSTIPEDVFRNLTSLQHLSLSANHLLALPAAAFTGLSNLISIHLDKNNISSVEADLFDDQEIMEKLYLSDNDLQGLPEGLFIPLISLRTVRLQGNPWKCDCHMRDFHDWLTDANLLMSDVEKIYCAKPKPLKGRGLVFLSREDLVCAESAVNNYPVSTGDKRHRTKSCSLHEMNGKVSIRCTVPRCPAVKLEVQFSDEDGRRLTFADEQKWSDSTQCNNATIILNF
ncbi:uncharacterized protein [Paramormyrops kingsleyae]|uniref:uncharacterized protein isoform X1 n=2 Tax=Paramormyrops kingsleyae TaxID=1676925 RepID=UPI000CD5CF70|nr:carboxypeptidase N subunit 2-like [Paramormyrops kingsleyae]XP_023653991.1 carboxypeptidase N subunit 2-like [Paramormyrops kingsleyae]